MLSGSIWLFTSIGFAAEPGNWFMVFNQTRLHTKLSLHSEIQYRSFELNPNSEQLLLRAGINYHHNSNLILSSGYGRISNYSSEPGILKDFSSLENRLWEQVTLKNNFGRVFLEHRYRLEQRWIKSSMQTDYKNRVRYLLRISIPINRKEVSKNTLFVTLYDEVFLHFSNNAFDRNRLYSALGFQFTKNANFQLGYLLQTVGSKSKNFLQVGLNYNLDFRKD